MKNSFSIKSAMVVCIPMLLWPIVSHAKGDQPLWEVGAGLGALSLPDYRGSDEHNTYVLPVPYFIYRGEWLKADRSGVRGRIFDNDKLEVNLSLNATLPVNSTDNRARRGMSSLRPTVELGPTFNFNVWRSTTGKAALDFRAPLRASVTVESSPKHVGWLFSPALNLDIQDPGGWSGWNLGMLAGPLFNSRRYNEYFYSVGAADATPGRPVYSAPGGYSGSQLTVAMSKRFQRYWVGGFMRYDSLAGARFKDSPLVRQQNAFSAGIAVNWIFAESSKRVIVAD